MTDDKRNTAELNVLGRNGPSGTTEGSSGLTCPAQSRVVARRAKRWTENWPSTDKQAWAQKMRAGGRSADRRRRGVDRLAQ